MNRVLVIEEVKFLLLYSSKDLFFISMEAKNLLCRLSLDPPTIPTHHILLQKPSHIRVPAPSSSSLQYQKPSFCRIHCIPKLVSQRLRSRKTVVLCRKTGDTDQSDDSATRLRRKRLAVFVSGGGSNFRSIHEAIGRGVVYGDVVVLVTDKPGCGGAGYARDKGIPVILFPKSSSLPGGLSSIDLVTALQSFEIDFLLLAGFLKLIPVELVRAYPKSINIHPSLLPAFGGKGFYGLKVHKSVIASGARYSGPTVHFVDEHYDTGRILAQRVVPVLVRDTAEELAARVLREEHQVYVEAVAAFCEERIIWREDGVPLIRSKENSDNCY